jgi:ABC-type dipeptide/oligopeptide/nickel transport system ATPase component
MKLTIPELAIVALVGPSGSGKSSFARKHFRGTEILSSDFCRGLVSDDENSQAATNDAFALLHFIASKRLAAGKLVVIDATNVQPVEPGLYMLLRFQKAAVRGNYATGNPAFSMHSIFLTIGEITIRQPQHR